MTQTLLVHNLSAQAVRVPGRILIASDKVRSGI